MAGAIAAAHAVRDEAPQARLTWAEPLISVTASGPEDAEAARAAHLAQFEALDMVMGLAAPELGGSARLVDQLGLNYYPQNQWQLGGRTLYLGHPHYRPLSDLLVEAHARYGRPMILAETGAEGCGRSAWLHYVCDQLRQAQARGVPIDAVCLYPITDYPGWDNERSCPAGLFSEADDQGGRQIEPVLAEELARQMALEADRALASRTARPAVQA